MITANIGDKLMPTLTTAAKDTTLEMRLRKDDKEVLRTAAKVKRQSLTEFILDHTMPIARSIVERQNNIQLTEAAWNAFVTMTEGNYTAPPLAKREAAAFLAEMADDQSLRSAA